MKHSTAIERNLAPQMEEYHRMGAQIDWRPYIMFFHANNYKSSIIHPDRFGFRLSHGRTGEPIAVADSAGKDADILVGNSVSFGVGATSDQFSLASRLALHCGTDCLVFSGRAYCAMQELLLFQSCRHLFGKTRRVILFSGSNDLYMHYAPKPMDEIFGGFFYSAPFYANMARRHKPIIGWKRKLMAGLLYPFYGDGIDYASVKFSQLPAALRATPESEAPASIEENAAERRMKRDVVIEHLGRTLEVWAMLARGMNFQLVYALQPILEWTGKTLSPEEAALLDERNAIGLPWHRMLGQISDADHYHWYRNAIQSRCEQLGIGFIDTNEALRHRSDWLFIDRLHLTDAGQNACAEGSAAALA